MKDNLVHIAICDDNTILRNLVKRTCEKYLEKHDVSYDLKLFTDGAALLQYNETIDILFLDVEMPGMNGFEVAGEINKKYSSISIIFLTNHVELIQKAFAVKAFRYLFKPISENDFFEALEEAINEFFHVQHIIVEYKGSSTLLDIRDIVYIESLGDETILYAKQESYINTYTMKKWISILDNIYFFQCHKSYIVNFMHIKDLKENKLILKDGNDLPVSVRNRKLIKEKMYEYIKIKAKYM